MSCDQRRISFWKDPTRKRTRTANIHAHNDNFEFNSSNRKHYAALEIAPERDDLGRSGVLLFKILLSTIASFVVITSLASTTSTTIPWAVRPADGENRLVPPDRYPVGFPPSRVRRRNHSPRQMSRGRIAQQSREGELFPQMGISWSLRPTKKEEREGKNVKC
jgi:hypothetical protein